MTYNLIELQTKLVSSWDSFFKNDITALERDPTIHEISERMLGLCRRSFIENEKMKPILLAGCERLEDMSAGIQQITRENSELVLGGVRFIMETAAAMKYCLKRSNSSTEKLRLCWMWQNFSFLSGVFNYKKRNGPLLSEHIDWATKNKENLDKYFGVKVTGNNVSKIKHNNWLNLSIYEIYKGIDWTQTYNTNYAWGSSFVHFGPYADLLKSLETSSGTFYENAYFFTQYFLISLSRSFYQISVNAAEWRNFICDIYLRLIFSMCINNAAYSYGFLKRSPAFQRIVLSLFADERSKETIMQSIVPSDGSIITVG